jgi:GntR family transcriptional regulator
MVPHIASIGRVTARASKTERQRLALRVSSRVARLQRVQNEDLGPMVYESIVLPIGRLPGLDLDRAATMTISEIAQECGLILGLATERIGVVDVDPQIALHLAVTNNQKVLKIDRVTATADGVPIEWRIAFMPLSD